MRKFQALKMSIVAMTLTSSLGALASFSGQNGACIIYKDVKSVVASHQINRVFDLYDDKKNKAIRSIKNILKKKSISELELFLENRVYGQFDLVLHSINSDSAVEVIRLNLSREQDFYSKSQKKSIKKIAFIELVQEALEKSLETKILLASEHRTKDCQALEFLANGEIDHDLKITQENGLLVLTHLKDFGRSLDIYTISNEYYHEIAKKLFEQKKIKL